MRRIAFGLAAQLLASPAAAQMTQYWLPNGPGGTTYNNPQGSLSGTYYNNALRRQADMLRWQQQRGQQAGRPRAAAPGPSFRPNRPGMR